MLQNDEPFIIRLRDARRRRARVGTCEPVIAEMYFGLAMSSSREENTIKFRRGLHLISCWPLDRAASEIYGQLAADLRRIGRAMQTIDIMLAAISFSLGDCTVVTTDSDLSAVPGLSVENWASPIEGRGS